jgi:hypothetical protein
MNRTVRRDLFVFALLVVFGVAGRWLQPAWNFTPLVAATALGGFYFRSWAATLAMPLATLAISDLGLAPHDNAAVQASVYAMTVLPAALGRLARRVSGWRRLACWTACSFVPATAFFLVTNFVGWATGGLYERTWAGLAECFAMALPFYRTMLAGDVFYVAIVAGCVAAAEALDRKSMAVEPAKK